MSEQKLTSKNSQSQDQNVNRNRDAEDTRESSQSVRPGSGVTHSNELPRGGTR